ncbi:MAG: hypothetical protein ACJ8FO_04430, partial [Sphingomicrobium sp.]
ARRLLEVDLLLAGGDGQRFGKPARHLTNAALGEDIVKMLFKPRFRGGDRSYGIAVAKLAGLPPAVVTRARSVLAKFEAGRDATGGIAAGLDDLPLFAAAPETQPGSNPLVAALEAIDPDRLSPREALDKLYELKRVAQSSEGTS